MLRHSRLTGDDIFARRGNNRLLVVIWASIEPGASAGPTDHSPSRCERHGLSHVSDVLWLELQPTR